MASDQLTAAIIRVYAESPQGDRKLLFSGINEQTGPGGSPDGAQATVKANELPFMPLNGFQVAAGWKIVVTGEMTAADGADASDSIMNIPYTDQGGVLKYLSVSDVGYTTDLPAASVASVQHQLGAGKTVPEGESWRLGGGTYFLSWENDT